MSKQMLVRFTAACLYYSGLVHFARWRTQRRGASVIILNYHRAMGGNLRSHMLYLHRHYRIMHLEEALEELYGQPKGRKQILDRRTPLVLTFDDGYRDNYTHAFTLARELQIPITIFLIPGYISSGNYFWWLEGQHLTRHTNAQAPTIEGRTYHLKYQEERDALSQDIDARVRYATAVSEREAFLSSVRQILATTSSRTDDMTMEEKGMLPLTWAEIKEMQESGWVSFGAHTMHHPVLAYLAHPAHTRFEVEACRTLLEEQLGHPIRTFAYPLGREEHIGKEALHAVKGAGYQWAVTTIYGKNTPLSDPYQLRRIVGNVKRHWWLVAAETAGVWQTVVSGYRWLRGKRSKES